MPAHIVIGQPLPRAQDAWTVPGKLTWLLSARHSREFARVFRIGHSDADRLWAAIALAIRAAPVISTRDIGDGTVSCRVDVILELEGRSAQVRTAWHYAHVDAKPRLVTAFPTL